MFLEGPKICVPSSLYLKNL